MMKKYSVISANIFAYFIILGSGCQSKHIVAASVLNLQDSAEVVNFNKSTSLCYKLKYIEDNKVFFCKGTGYSNLILKEVSEQIKEEIFLPIVTGNTYMPLNQQEKQLQEQIEEIKSKYKCL